jgi:transcriptional antiterminator Rof (Rho-off)
MNKEYIPIDCGLHDELELRAIRKQKIKLSYFNEKNEIETNECVITDVYSKDSTEFLKTDFGLTIRLDNLLEMDNIIFNKSC